MKSKTLLLAAATVLIAATAIAGVIASGATQATQTAQDPPANTATVERGTLSAMISQSGTLTYRGQVDGSPYSVINQARGTYTKLPADGDEVTCGDVVYRVDDNPVIMLCGLVPAYRDLHSGLVGDDVRQLNENLTSSATTPPLASSLTPPTLSSPGRLSRRSGCSRTTRPLT